MQVILLEKVHNLGALGDKVKVKAGFGRNYLIPYGKAVFATQANLEAFDAKRAMLEQKAIDSLQAAEKRDQALKTLGSVTIAAKAADEGKLYGSIGSREIAEAITQAGVAVERKEVLLPLGPFRQVGEFTIELQLHSDVLSRLQLKVVSSAA